MIRHLLNTTVFRLSLVYALLFSLIAAMAMASVYWVAESHIKRQVDTRLQLEADVFLSRIRIQGTEYLLQRVDSLIQDGGNEFSVHVLNHRNFADLLELFKPEYISLDGRELFATHPMNEILNYSPNAQADEPARMLLYQLPNSGYQLLVATDMSEQKALLDKMYRSTLMAIAVIISLALFGGGLMGYNVLRRIDSISRTADTIISGDLSQRMHVTWRNDEFDRLSLVVNNMLQRIEQLMIAVRGVTDNLAHDLRNPLNRLRNRLESVRFLDPQSGDYQQANTDAIQDVDELIKTFNALLSIAQAESRVQRKDWSPVDLSELVNDLGDLYSVVAEDKDQQLDYQAEPNLVLMANRQLLAQVITNLLDNAVKYTPSGGAIRLEARRDGSNLLVRVADTGIGIPPDKRERVFERFVRLDNARSSPGNGLGLSLVKAVADMHGGSIALGDNQPGLVVSMSFPLPAAGMVSMPGPDDTPARSGTGTPWPGEPVQPGRPEKPAA
ncbi:MAG: HAMP domain-containing histidine kinase [Thiothrix sp.]|nr:HAMP domain-containing histidine kinase [Thiothrix sp.]HPQ96562.1 HAMP domain-containing sensor histidine kinase [Thiolinea sp.]